MALGARKAPPAPSLISGAFGRRGPQPGLCAGIWREGEAPPERLCAFLLPGWAILLGAAGHLGQFGPALLALSQEWKRRERFR